MKNNDIIAKLKTLFADIFEISEDEINDKSSPETIEKWDSFQHLQLILALEEAFQISLTADEVTEIQSFEYIKNLLIERLQ
jgi:acyl carrier protein